MNDADRYYDAFVYFMAPEREDEPGLRDRIASLPRVRVSVDDDATLLAKGFRKGECHRNCMAAVSNDRSLQHVWGWSISPLMYLAHSVLRVDGALRCITPGHTDTLDENGCFEFAEDAGFLGNGYHANATTRGCLQIVRRDVEAVRRHYGDLHRRVTAGVLTFDQAVALSL